MEPKESPILQGLNPAQRDAVVNYDSPSLIIAGAGSGKTRVLTSVSYTHLTLPTILLV